MRTWWRVVFLVTLLAACGGGDSDGVVESGDGLATLLIQPGSLPEGVSLDDVQIEVIVDENGEPGFPVMAVQLLPHGLVLVEPATLTILLPEALEDGFMALHQSGNFIEFLNGEILRDDDGLFSFITPIGHFSVLTIISSLFFEASMTVDPVEVSEDQIQGAVASIAAKAGPISVLFHFEIDPHGTVRLFTFSAPQPPIVHEQAVIYRIPFKGKPPGWDPQVHNTEIVESPFGWETSRAEFKCLESNTGSPYLSSTVSFYVTLLSRGEPEAFGFLSFSQALSAEETQTRPITGSSSVDLLGLSPGDKFQASGRLLGGGPSVCVEAGGSGTGTTSTTSTTMSSDGETGGDQKKKTNEAAGEEAVSGSDFIGFTLPSPGVWCLKTAAPIETIFDGSAAEWFQFNVFLFKDEQRAENFEWDYVFKYEQYRGDEPQASISALPFGDPPPLVPPEAKLEVKIDGSEICFDPEGLAADYRVVMATSLVTPDGADYFIEDSSPILREEDLPYLP